MHSGVIAIPTNDPAGLQGEISDHFGHSRYFTLVSLDEGRVLEVDAIANAQHGPGGCQVVVQLLQSRKVNTVIAKGMGSGPYAKLSATGIQVLFAAPERYPDVQSVVNGLQALCRQPFGEQNLCQGKGNCHQHGGIAQDKEN